MNKQMITDINHVFLIIDTKIVITTKEKWGYKLKKLNKVFGFFYLVPRYALL
jgi:hypothetical protein